MKRIAIASAALIAACGGGDPGQEATPIDTYAGEPFDSTLFLEASANAMLMEERFDGTLMFNGQPAELAAVDRGNVLIFPPSTLAPNGMMRFVVRRSEENGNLALRTVRAPIQLAFKKLDVKAGTRTIDRLGERVTVRGLRPADSGMLGDSKMIEFYPFNADGDTTTTGDQVRVTGLLSGYINYDFGMSFDWGDVKALPEAVVNCIASLVEGSGCSVAELLPEIKVGYGIFAGVDASIEIEGAAFSGFEREYSLAKIVGTPIPIGPLLFYPELEITALVKGGASSRFKVGTGAAFSAGAGISFSSKHDPVIMPPDEMHTFATPTADVALGANAQAKIGPKIAIKLFDIAGPYASLLAGAELDADIAREPCFQLRGRCDLDVGFDISVDLPPLGKVELAKWGTEYPLFSEMVSSGACASPAGANTLPPGSGPDDTHLANPTFTPWSRMLDGSLRTFGHTGNSLHGSNLTQTVDGAYVASSAGSAVISKWSGDGDRLWAKEITDRETPGGPEPLELGRAVQLEDMTLLVSAENGVLLELDQDGTLLWSARLSAPHAVDNGGPYGNSTQQHRFMGLAPDGEGGAFIAATNDPQEHAPTDTWLMRMKPDGTITWSKRLHAGGGSLYPMSLVRVDNSVLVTGLDWTEGQDFRGWAALIDGSGAVTWAKRLTGPMNTPDLEPTTAIRLFNGNLVIAGVLGFYRRAFVLGLKPDGTILWTADPWTGSDLSYMVIDSLAELPTTGLIAGGHYTLGNELPRTFTAGLDAVGRMQWLRGYRFAQPNEQAKFASVELSDDGGVLALSHSTLSTQGNGSLWLMKVFAKDGEITFEGEDGPLMFENAEAMIAEAPLALTVSDLAFSASIPLLDVKDF